MARHFWPGGDAVGRMIRTSDANDDDLVVVGIAADAKIRTLGEAPRDMIYRPAAQHETRGLSVVARTSAAPKQTALALMSAGRSIDPDFWVWEVKTMDRHLAIGRLPAELPAFILTAFAGLALMLAGIGLYGVVSYAVAQRTREMGIRVALGADPRHVVRLVAFDGLRLVLIGGVLGMTAALALSRLLSGLLFGGRAFDPLTPICGRTRPRSRRPPCSVPAGTSGPAHRSDARAQSRVKRIVSAFDASRNLTSDLHTSGMKEVSAPGQN